MAADQEILREEWDPNSLGPTLGATGRLYQNGGMQCAEFLDVIERRLEDQIKRGRSVGHSMSPEQLNWSPGADKWSMAQIYEHMMLGNSFYLQIVRDAIDASLKGGNEEIKHSFVGKLIIRAAGPKGNAPPPRQMVPEPGPYTPDIVERWAGQTQAFLDMAKSAHQVDLCSHKVRNPFFTFLSMNLADCFMILAEHTERHVQQIETLRDRCHANLNQNPLVKF
jgi:hypothetical protein